MMLTRDSRKNLFILTQVINSLNKENSSIKDNTKQSVSLEASNGENTEQESNDTREYNHVSYALLPVTTESNVFIK